MLFYEPTPEHLTKLHGPWCASYSGGKDSTSLVTWIEWLRRTGQIDVPRPQLVQSDTGVEDSHLEAVSVEMRNALTASGWECAVVTPAINQRLYNRILGIGLPPVHAGIRRMRWCTRSTKIDPMELWRDEHSSGLTLTGLRIGESAIRDGKILKAKGCSAGGECGIPDPSERTYSPLLNWRTCHVIDWLNGLVGKEVREVMPDLFAITQRLVAIYGVRLGQPTFDFAEREITSARYGCIGCPAIQAEAHPPASVIRRNGAGSPLNEIYAVWFEARKNHNRLYKFTNKWRGPGPVKLAVRPTLFARIMDIQRRAGVVLVTPDDEAFIRQCWADKVYPRGWSEEDESVLPPVEDDLFSIANPQEIG